MLCSMWVLGLTPTAALAGELFGDDVYYLGDIHAHSGISGDGGASDLEGTCAGDCGTFADLYQTARDAGLDFAAVTDHINGIHVTASSDDYAALVAMAVAEDDPGTFVTLPAAEVWFSTAPKTGDLGHKSLLFFGDDATLADLTIDDLRPSSGSSILVSSCTDVWSWADTLQATWGDVLTIPHHPALTAPMPTDWSCMDPQYEPTVEVYSEHGSSMGDGTAYDPPWSGEEKDGTVHYAIDPSGAALQLGFVGGTDKHNSRPGDVCERDDEFPNHLYGGGLTIAVIPDGERFDRTALYRAFTDRRTLATTGPLLPVSIAYSSGNVALGGLGSSFLLPNKQDLDVRVSIPPALVGYVSSVELVSPKGRFSTSDDGAGTWTGSVPTGDAIAWTYAAIRIDGAAWYASGCDDGGSDTDEYVWTSPGYYADGPDDLDHDGVSYLAGDCADDDPARAPGFDDPAGDGVDQDCDVCDGVCEGRIERDLEVESTFGAEYGGEQDARQDQGSVPDEPAGGAAPVPTSVSSVRGDLRIGSARDTVGPRTAEPPPALARDAGDRRIGCASAPGTGWAMLLGALWLRRRGGAEVAYGRGQEAPCRRPPPSSPT